MKPDATGIHFGSSDSSTAGFKSEKKLAAIMIPDEKPRQAFIILSLSFLKKNTIKLPDAVKNQVPSVDKNARRM